MPSQSFKTQWGQVKPIESQRGGKDLFFLVELTKHNITALIRVMLVAWIRAPGRPYHNGIVLLFPLPATLNRNKVIDLLCRGERRKYTCLETDGDVTSCHRSVVVSYQSRRRTEPVDSAQLSSSLNVINPNIKKTPRDPCFWLLKQGILFVLDFQPRFHDM